MRTVPITPKKTRTIEAGSYIKIPYVSRDDDLALETPSAVRYRIDNITDSVQIQDWTAVGSPTTNPNEITIAGSVNAMSRTWRNRQKNQVTIEITTPTGVKTETAVYEIVAVVTAAASS